MRLQQTVMTLGLGLSLAACGGAGVMAATTSSAELTDDGGAVLAQVRLITGEFASKSNSPECLALRGKVFAERQEVKIGSEWQTVTKTPEYQTLDKHAEQFKNSDCDVRNPGANQVCADLEKTLEQDASALSKTPQWQTLDNNDHWHTLQTDYAKAQKIGCL